LRDQIIHRFSLGWATSFVFSSCSLSFCNLLCILGASWVSSSFVMSKFHIVILVLLILGWGLLCFGCSETDSRSSSEELDGGSEEVFQPKVFWSLTDEQYLSCVQCLTIQGQKHAVLVLSAPSMEEATLICAPFPFSSQGNYWGLHYFEGFRLDCDYGFLPRLYTKANVQPKSGEYLFHKLLHELLLFYKSYVTYNHKTLICG